MNDTVFLISYTIAVLVIAYSSFRLGLVTGWATNQPAKLKANIASDVDFVTIPRDIFERMIAENVDLKGNLKLATNLSKWAGASINRTPATDADIKARLKGDRS